MDRPGSHLILMLKIKKIYIYIYVHTFYPTHHTQKMGKTTKIITIIKNKHFINRKCKLGFFFFAWGVNVQQHTRTRVAEPNLSFYFSELQKATLIFNVFIFTPFSSVHFTSSLFFFTSFLKKIILCCDLGWQTFQLYLSLLHMTDYGVTV